MVREHISLVEAWNILRNSVNHMGCTESVTVDQSYGRVLCEDIIANRNIPHFNASAVDGYAVPSERTAGATSATPVTLTEGFYWVNTGMPTDYDSVLMVEDSSLKNGELIVTKSLTAGENVRPIGEDVSIGQIAAKKGDVISPSLAALFIALGLSHAPVYRLPKTVFIPTGDEIVTANEWTSYEDAPYGKTAESNSAMITGYFKSWGFPIDCIDAVADDTGQIIDALEKVHDKYDLVLIGAGSAKGEKDFISSILKDKGEIYFHWLLMKPARPAMFGRYKNCYVINLPGFPMSSAVALWSVAYPLLKILHMGNFDEDLILSEALCSCGEAELPLLFAHSSPAGKIEWLRLKAVELNGVRTVYPLSSGASTMWAIAEADGVAVLPEPLVECPKGSKINVLFTRKIDWKRRILFQGSNDPAFERVGSFVKKYGGEIVIRSVGSLGGLAALSRGEAHVASCHLLDANSGKYNDSYIERLRGEEKWIRILLFWREQGIIVRSGNPQNIKGVEDFTREDVSIINRQPGAGTRVLLDYMLKERGITPQQVKGYNCQSITHFDAANRVAAGLASATIAIRVAALGRTDPQHGLSFIPITVEPYELVIPEKYLGNDGIKALMKAIEDVEWRAQVEKMGGYK
ncbi:MAG: molybdopterin-binding protein, partial [Synergistaceae bacterium]|nr:molybdopterin-binding protein [Synergistaceae bacterium]